jgi:CheY-like chemotaxis protein
MYSQFGFMAHRDVDDRQGRRLLVAHGDPRYVAAVSDQFRRLGWDVQVAKNGVEARQLARSRPPSVVILAADSTEETGWLTCAKLMRELPHVKVILVSRDLAPECFRLTQFVGAAALVAQRDGVRALLDEVCGDLQMPAVG